MKKTIVILILFLFTPILYCQIFSQYTELDTNNYAGFRASRILSSYPDRQFPEPEYWEMVGKEMSENLDGYQPGGLWIVSMYLSDPEGYTLMSFPKPEGRDYDSIIFRDIDQNEKYLNHFDTTGIKVWLQVESGGANIDTLVNLVFNQYKHHSCVLGFGVDVEWYKTSQHQWGKKVSDAEAEHWEQKIKAIKPEYTLFLKHFSTSWMPPNYRGDIVFIDDSQDFNWYSDPFTGMVTEFKNWGQKFYPNDIGFQIGYPLDQNWWADFEDPAKEIGNRLVEHVPNMTGFYWVDFTVIEVFPPELVSVNVPIMQTFYLSQNYPNPFNPSTMIRFTLDQSSFTSLSLFDVKGSKVKTLFSGYKSIGTYDYKFDGADLPSGIYFYQLTTQNTSITKKMMLVK